MDNIEKVVKHLGYTNTTIIEKDNSYHVNVDKLTDKNFLDFRHYISKKELKYLSSFLRNDIISDILGEEKKEQNIYTWKVGESVIYDMDVLFISVMVDSNIASLTDGLTSLVHSNMDTRTFKLTPDNLSLSIDFKRFYDVIRDYEIKENISDIISYNWSKALENKDEWQKYFNIVEMEVNHFISNEKYLS